jgi:hypothetical protein
MRTAGAEALQNNALKSNVKFERVRTNPGTGAAGSCSVANAFAGSMPGSHNGRASTVDAGPPGQGSNWKWFDGRESGAAAGVHAPLVATGSGTGIGQTGRGGERGSSVEAVRGYRPRGFSDPVSASETVRLPSRSEPSLPGYGGSAARSIVDRSNEIGKKEGSGRDV